MDTKVSELTVSRFTEIIEDVVERKLSDLLRDPDEGLALRPEFEQRLRKSLAYVESGGKTLSLEEITGRLEGELRVVGE
ncbi:MAG: hypothetical protein MAG431_02012 [Chloroflexi bacterium]|nr:hypothetical protein [Chloroflexota bacterium]